MSHNLAFAVSGRWDRVIAFVAPRLLGGRAAPTPLGGAGFGSLERAGAIDRLTVRRRGVDLVIEGLRAGCLLDLSSNAGG